MFGGVVYLPGQFPSGSGPLQRYLPPLPSGAATAWLANRAPPGSWVIDPFGASPSLLAEAARAGYRLLATVNNPISRFLIELYANPPGEADLRAALAELASTQKAGERIEPKIRALYQTECAQCGSTIEAQAFVWERDGGADRTGGAERAGMLVGRIYNCPVCKDSGERPATPADVERARKGASSALHRARALERVAAFSDPDRAYAEEALAVYPSRAIHTLFDLTNRLDVLAEPRRRWAEALLLAAFDQSNGLWHHPPARYRPKQLGLPQRYLEKNVWLTLERAILSWAVAPREGGARTEPVSVTTWPELPGETGGICLFEGRLKDLAAQIETGGTSKLKIRAMLGALPRPNQAFWTLSALWAGWLWGQAASAPFKSVLRRRRYDWNWHVVALSAALSSLGGLVEEGTPCLGLIGEAEPGFLSAAILAGELAGFDLEGLALRSGQEQAQIHWIRRNEAEQSVPVVDEATRRALVRKQMVDFLRQSGEPAGYLKMHAAALVGLVKEHAAVPAPGSAPPEVLRQAEEAIQGALSRGSPFTRFGAAGRSLETGQWWLEAEQEVPAEQGPKPRLGVPAEQEVSRESRQKGERALPLADRVEIDVVRYIQANPGGGLAETDQAVCQDLSGLFTPDLEIIQECLESYSEIDPGEAELQDERPEGSDRRRLRVQDDPATRRADLAEMQETLIGLGRRLGFRASLAAERSDQENRPPVVWRGPDGAERYRFYLTASGVLGKIVLREARGTSAQAQRLIVLPGGRAGLVEAKLRHDLRLRAVVEAGGTGGSGWRFLKYRHVRWLADNQNLSQENLEESLGVDPLANRDPQMPLL